MLDPHALTKARLEAGMTVEDLSAKAAAIGHRWLSAYQPEDDHGTLREDLEHYVEQGELGRVANEHSDWYLPPTHMYITWLAQALNTSPLRLIDTPLEALQVNRGGVPRVGAIQGTAHSPNFPPRFWSGL